MKRENGITLIALVITIIVLLILAGVSIAMLTGENGILSKATEAGSETKLAEEKEQVVLAINALTTEYYDEKYVSNTSITTELKDYVIAGLTEEDGKNNVEEYATVTTAGVITTKSTDKNGKKQTATYDGKTKLNWTAVTGD